MKLLDDYFKIQKEIYDYFGYVENWRVIPIEDTREYYWYLVANDYVRFADSIEDLENEKVGDYYENEVYIQRFLTQWVYRAKDYTMICVDTHTDENKFLRIFDNEKEVNPDELYGKE
jgi:hypothetical protein